LLFLFGLKKNNNFAPPPGPFPGGARKCSVRGLFLRRPVPLLFRLGRAAKRTLRVHFRGTRGGGRNGLCRLLPGLKCLLPGHFRPLSRSPDHADHGELPGSLRTGAPPVPGGRSRGVQSQCRQHHRGVAAAEDRGRALLRRVLRQDPVQGRQSHRPPLAPLGAVPDPDEQGSQRLAEGGDDRLPGCEADQPREFLLCGLAGRPWALPLAGHAPEDLDDGPEGGPEQGGPGSLHALARRDRTGALTGCRCGSSLGTQRAFTGHTRGAGILAGTGASIVCQGSPLYRFTSPPLRCSFKPLQHVRPDSPQRGPGPLLLDDSEGPEPGQRPADVRAARAQRSGQLVPVHVHPSTGEILACGEVLQDGRFDPGPDGHGETRGQEQACSGTRAHDDG